MGDRGPQPNPEAVNDLRGNPGKRAKKKSAKFPAGECRCPDWLGEVGRAKWEEIFAKVDAIEGLMKPAFEDSLAFYCEAFEEFVAAREEIAKFGTTCMSNKGGLYQHPAVGRKNKAIQRMKQFGALFGLSPVNESDLPLDPNADASKAQNDLLTLMRSRQSKN